jgi:hypothetical protein
MPTSNYKPFAPSVSVGIKVIEEWLNETLDSVNDLKLNKKILQNDKKRPINQYGIDRISLNNAGIPEEVINRIYRCLFVYSTGFHQLISKLLQHTDGKYRVIKNIWRTFAVLLEYCCKTDYDSLLDDIEREYREKQEDIENSFKDEIESLKNEKVKLTQGVDEMQNYMHEIEK